MRQRMVSALTAGAPLSPPNIDIRNGNVMPDSIPFRAANRMVRYRSMLLFGTMTGVRWKSPCERCSAAIASIRRSASASMLVER